MTPSNVPDDWDCFWTTCGTCGARYHASEGGCCEGEPEDDDDDLLVDDDAPEPPEDETPREDLP